MEKITLLNLWIIVLTIGCIALFINGIGIQRDLETAKGFINSCELENIILQNENTAQLNKLMENANIIQLQNDFLVEIEPTCFNNEPVKCEQDNTALLELFNKCTFLDTENYQYVQFPIGVNVSELLNPKTIHSHSTTTEYITTIEYKTPECPVLSRCPAGKTMQCLSVDRYDCETDCSCIANNIN